jgi:hypothetical protein
MKTNDTSGLKAFWAAAWVLAAPGALLPANIASFNAPKAYAVGSNPVSVAVGDFNQDGKPDLAVANRNNDTVSILLGNGKGTFLRVVNHPAGPSPNAVVVGDFNGDGRLDLAVANEGPNTISILLGNGDGTFKPPASYAAIVDSGFLAVGDFNGDGKPDLIVGGSNSNAVSVLLGNGDGSFQSPVVTTVGISNPFPIAVGDFNGDGRLDFAEVAFNTQSVSILLGNGDGSFQPPVTYALEGYVQSLVAADFNGDGKPDLAVATCCYPDTGTVWILLGNGDGSFQKPIGSTVYGVSNLVIGDFNGDGKPDLAAATAFSLLDGGPYGFGFVSILLGNGKGGFRETVTRNVGGTPASMAVGDFNGDGRPDVAAVISASNDVSILLNPFGQAAQYPTGTSGTSPSSVAVGDFNGDGKPDLAVANYICNNCVNPPTGSVSILLGNGDSTFQPQVSYAAGNSPLSVAVGDFNGDGKPDLAVAGYNGVSILLGNGDGTFQPQVSYMAGTSLVSVAVGDFNGDGKLDLAAVNPGSYPNGGSVSILLGNGDGTFRAPVTYALAGSALFVTVGDFNGDGKADLAVVNGGISILLGNGNGTFQPQVYYSLGANSIAVGDFNGDGISDLAVVGGVGNFDDPGFVSILLGRRNGTFQPPVTYALPPGASVAVGDFNGDGKPDLAVACYSTNSETSSQVSILLGQGNVAFFAQPMSFVAGVGSSFFVSGSSLAAADFSGDGKLDLAVVDTVSNSVEVLTNITP